MRDDSPQSHGGARVVRQGQARPAKEVSPLADARETTWQRIKVGRPIAIQWGSKKSTEDVRFYLALVTKVPTSKSGKVEIRWLAECEDKEDEYELDRAWTRREAVHMDRIIDPEPPCERVGSVWRLSQVLPRTLVVNGSRPKPA